MAGLNNHATLAFLLVTCYDDDTMKYLTSNPAIMSDVPVIKGTRIPIEVILYWLKEGCSIKAIHKLYSWVSLKTLEGALDEAIQAITTLVFDYVEGHHFAHEKRPSQSKVF